MRFGLRGLRRLLDKGSAARKPRPFRPLLETLEDRNLLSADFLQTNLVSDIPGLANTLDLNLVNAWGLTASATSPFWVANQGTGTSMLYNGQGVPQPAGNPLIVTIPTNPDGSPLTHGSPTGIVANIDTNPNDFLVSEDGKSGSARFLWVTTDGTISGWNPAVNGTNAIVEATTPGAVYTGLAIATDPTTGQTLLYAANFASGTIDVFDSNFQPVASLPDGAFTDPNLPADFKPFNIQAINGQLYVEYAPLDPSTGGVLAGAGNGAVDVFSLNGQLQQTLIPNGPGGVLNDPWGIALAPSSFGKFGGDLLVGNFGSGDINAFDPTSGQFLGQLTTSSGQPFDVEHLWSLRFGNGVSASADTLFFTAGLTSHFGGTSDLPPHGLFGSLQAIPTLAPNSPIVSNLANVPEQSITTVAPNGDQNPYGVAFVPQNFHGGGVLNPGDILVSNFNNAGDASNPGGVQGTGSTIVRITPDGQQSVFFQGDPGLGLTTALGVLPQGFVLVGSVPSTTDANGQATAQSGSLLILDSNGNQVGQISDDLVNSPWDLTINNVSRTQSQVFVSNVLTGTVTRIDLHIPRDASAPVVERETQIASGFATATDPTALVLGPTGLAFDRNSGTLFVASTADNALFAIPNAAFTRRDHGTGTAIVQNDPHLHGPLGLALAPNGDLIVANGDAVNPDSQNANLISEFTPDGQFVDQFQLDGGGPGGPFGIAMSSVNGQVRFAAVNDNTNSLDVFTFNTAQA